jgi:hypothetical protein
MIERWKPRNGGERLKQIAWRSVGGWEVNERKPTAPVGEDKDSSMIGTMCRPDRYTSASLAAPFSSETRPHPRRNGQKIRIQAVENKEENYKCHPFYFHSCSTRSNFQDEGILSRFVRGRGGRYESIYC